MTDNHPHPTPWVSGELKLAGLDSRMIGLLQAIADTGSINQAAKQMGLSYKGAWQIIERANNGSPKTLVSTATGGSKGGGTCLTEAGNALLELFSRLEQKHSEFIETLNLNLANDPDMVLLLQRMVVKTSARNQLFGRISAIQSGAVNAEVTVQLKGGEPIVVNISQTSLSHLDLKLGADAVLLINGSDITLDLDSSKTSARNRLASTVIRLQQDDINSEVMVLLPGGETLGVMITQESTQKLELKAGMAVWALFKSNAPILGVIDT